MERSPRDFSVNAINNLPDNIIDSILSHLPLRDAVRTSILSREWRHRWISIPELVFDSKLERWFLHNHKIEHIIYHVLLRHQGPINKFTLQVPSCRSGPDIDLWVLFLSSSKVQDFTLHIFSGDKNQISSYLFAFQHLKHLSFYRCVFKPPPQFKGFSKLITLDFQDVDFVPAIFGHFISQCSLLQRVRLVGCTDMDLFEVEGPCLRFFTFCGVFKTIRFKNSPVLAEVSLSTPAVTNRGILSFSGFEYFHILPTLEKLHLHPGVPKFLGAGVPVRLPDSLICLRVINLSMYLDSIEEVACAFCLARSSPNLQLLRVTLYASDTVEAVIEFIRSQETPDPYLHHLRRVEITLFSGFVPQIEFVRHLLASASELEEMVITVSSLAHGDPSLVTRLKQFPRASPSALLVIKLHKSIMELLR